MGKYEVFWRYEIINTKLVKEGEILKPDCPLIGENGNIFNLMGIASRTLKDNGMSEHAEEMRNKIMVSGSYEEALNILGEYVNITSVKEIESEENEGEVISL